MSNLYVIRGSEDGTIAVATSPRKAVAIAARYVEQCGGRAKWNETDNINEATLALQKHDCYWIELDNAPVGSVSCSNMARAEIEKFPANYYHGQF